MIRVIRRRMSGDDGASLLFALVMTTALSVVVAALLTYSAASMRSTVGGNVSTLARAKTVYDAGGALETAINKVRNSAYNDPGQACSGLTFPGPNGGTPVTVVCQGGPGTGSQSTAVPITAANKPGSALLTLGTNAGEPGINQTSNNTLRIHGQVYANSTIIANPGDLYDDNAPVIAEGSCSGTITSTPPPSCNAAHQAAGDDPAVAAPPLSYMQPSSGLVYRAVPSCPAGPTVKFQPGYYDDAVGLTNLMKNCTGKTFWFQPASTGGVGVYYFDFHNGEGGGLPSGSDVWTIDDSAAKVVGGTPSGWDPDAAPRQVPVIPGSCVSPLATTSNSGVEFVFGGDSRLEINAGQMELCGQYYADKPPIAVYGAKSGTDTTASALGKTDGTGTNLGSVNFTAVDKITENDNVPSTASLVNDSSASVRVTGFAPTQPVAAGSILTNAVLTIKHREPKANGKAPSLSATVIPARTGASPLAGIDQPVAHMDGIYNADAIDLTSQLAAEVHDHGFSGLTVTYGISSKNALTEDLDSIQLSLTWKPPAVRGETTSVGGTNCVGTAPYVPGSSNCALIRTQNSSTRFYVQGTTYVPYAALDIQVTNASGQVFRSGLIARSLRIKVTASTSFTGPVIEVPDDSPGLGPAAVDVYFTAYMCPYGQSCSGVTVGNPPWKLVGTAQASFDDGGGVPSPGHRKVTIGSWALHH
jgi:hypothetical protein